MSFSNKAFLFGADRIATAISGGTRFKHTFGGPHDRNGASREDCNGILLHLLHRLDLTDPAIPIAIPGVRWLPFYYCFDFRANDIGYQLLSEKTLVTFFRTDDPHVTHEESWPDDDYPLEFPKSTIAITAYDYDPTNLENAYAWAGIFGIDKLSKTDRALARKRMAEEMDSFGYHVPKTQKELEALLSSPFVQGKPNDNCMNPSCPNHKRFGQLATIALMPAEPVAGVHTFGRWGTEVELIFQMCKMCHTIRVGNQCT